MDKTQFIEKVTSELGGGLLAELDAEYLWNVYNAKSSDNKEYLADLCNAIEQVLYHARQRAELKK